MYMPRLLVVLGGIGLMATTAVSGEMKPQLAVHGRSGIEVTQRPVESTPTIAITRQGQGVGTNQERSQKENASKYHNFSRSMGNAALVSTEQDDTQDK